jgi:hypothetical protein
LYVPGKPPFLGIFAKTTAKGSDEHHQTEEFPLDELSLMFTFINILIL